MGSCVPAVLRQHAPEWPVQLPVTPHTAQRAAAGLQWQLMKVRGIVRILLACRTQIWMHTLQMVGVMLVGMPGMVRCVSAENIRQPAGDSHVFWPLP